MTIYNAFNCVYKTWKSNNKYIYNNVHRYTSGRAVCVCTCVYVCVYSLHNKNNTLQNLFGPFVRVKIISSPVLKFTHITPLSLFLFLALSLYHIRTYHIPSTICSYTHTICGNILHLLYNSNGFYWTIFTSWKNNYHNTHITTTIITVVFMK